MTFKHQFDIHFVDLVKALAKDTGVSVEDQDYVIRRFRSEGLRFLTFTLPSLSKAVITSLEVGEFIRPTTFAWKGKSLHFMYSFLSKIFDAGTGTVLADACPYSIGNLRQFCEYFYKLAVETSNEEKIAGEEKYIENERVVKSFEPCDTWVDALRKNLETFYPGFCRASISDVLAYHRPRFGPGSFAIDSDIEVNKTVYKRLPSDIIGITKAEFDGISGYFKSYPSSREPMRFVTEGKTSVVTFVAKDSRGPRVISMEPMHLLRLQMSFLDWSIKTLQKATDGRIQFEDQSRNQQHAKIASANRSMATLDLKDASDRVSFKLVSRVFKNTLAPSFYLRNARSTHTRLPSGKIIPLYKVAGMGSGLTFPTMALIIHLSICTQVSARTGVPYNKVMRSVHVYGDDVIVPTSWYNFAITALERSGLLVNKEKSFFRGFFRESCGGDFYKGTNVTPVKLKLDKTDLGPASLYKRFLRIENARQLYKVAMHTRELYSSKLITTKAFYDTLIKKALWGRYPKVTGDSPIIGEYTDNIVIRDNVKVQGFTLSPVKRKYTGLCGYKAIATKLLPKRVTNTFCSFKDIIVKTGIDQDVYVRPRDMELKLKRHPGTKTY
jgi:hypothetical protein